MIKLEVNTDEKCLDLLVYRGGTKTFILLKMFPIEGVAGLLLIKLHSKCLKT